MPTESTIRLGINGMNCGSCVGRVERLLCGLDGVQSAKVNLATASAAVGHDGRVTLARLEQALREAGYPAKLTTSSFDIEGMSCASCVARVEGALLKLPAVSAAEVNYATGIARVRHLPQLEPAQIQRAVTPAGYTARPHGEIIADEDKPEIAPYRREMFVAFALALPVFFLEMGGHLWPGLHGFVDNVIGMQNWRYLQFVMVGLILVGPGRQFFRLGVPALLRATPDMNSLVALGTSAAFGFSSVVTFWPQILPEASRNVYFEAAAVIVALLLMGRYLEARAKGQTGAAISKLAGLRAKTARVERDGAVVELPLDQIARGDVLHIRPGEKVAVDGVVLTGQSWVDESMITGEPLPVSKTTGASLTGGTINGNGAMTFRATHVGADMVLSQIIRLVEEAQGARLPIQDLVNRVTMYFVPAVILTALLTIGIWLLFGPEPKLAHALVAGVAVLIIACPCAMGLATPTSIMVGTGRAAELGVLFRRGDALQALQSVDVVAFDKTGTLTEGRPSLTDFHVVSGVDERELRRQVASAERNSEHPIASAIVADATDSGLDPVDCQAFEALSGLGVRARVEGHDLLIGAARLLSDEGIDHSRLAGQADALAAEGKTVLFVARDGQLAALIAVADSIRDSARAAVDYLIGRGIRVAMITGDGHRTAEHVAQQLNIPEIVAGVMPDGKVAALTQARQGGRLAFVGDGINDAPALASADIGIAIGTGTDIAIESADVVLMGHDLRAVASAIAISHATMANIRQNLFWAFGYNVLLIPVAAGALFPLNGMMLSPMLAAGAMALSSVLVVANALRLRRVKSPH